MWARLRLGEMGGALAVLGSGGEGVSIAEVCVCTTIIKIVIGS